MNRIAAIAVATHLAATAIAHGQNPDPLARFLQEHNDYHLLTLDDAAPWRALLEADNAFAPTAAGDVTGDHVPDLVAVLVRTVTTQKRFSVLSFHGTAQGRRGTVAWVVRDSSEPIVGVSIKADHKLVWAWHCYPCDDITDYRWTKDRYVEVKKQW